MRKGEIEGKGKPRAPTSLWSRIISTQLWLCLPQVLVLQTKMVLRALDGKADGV